MKYAIILFITILVVPFSYAQKTYYGIPIFPEPIRQSIFESKLKNSGLEFKIIDDTKLIVEISEKAKLMKIFDEVLNYVLVSQIPDNECHFDKFMSIVSSLNIYYVLNEVDGKRQITTYDEDHQKHMLVYHFIVTGKECE